jgi:hypothetical protein
MLSKALLVVLIGIYAIRSTWFIFSGSISPLTPVAAVGGVATFSNLKIDKAGAGYTLVATSGDLPENDLPG